MFDFGTSQQLDNTQLLDHDFHKTQNSLEEFPPIMDPIIQQMLAGKHLDPSDAEEVERLNRMMFMLKASKKYKRLSIQSANQKWESSSDSDLSDSAPQLQRHRRVRFSDSVEVIDCPPHSKPTLLEKLANASRKIKNIF